MGKFNYDYAAEMLRIANTDAHKNSMQKLAFSRDGFELGQSSGSELEDAMVQLAEKDCSCGMGCDSGCDCSCHDKDTKDNSDCDDGSEVQGIPAQASLEDTAALILEISDELESAGHERLAAASMALAGVMIKEAAALGKGAKKETNTASKSGTKSSPGSSKSQSGTGSKSQSQSGTGSKSKEVSKKPAAGKKLTMKERMAKMRAAQKGKKKAKK